MASGRGSPGEAHTPGMDRASSIAASEHTMSAVRATLTAGEGDQSPYAHRPSVQMSTTGSVRGRRDEQAEEEYRALFALLDEDNSGGLDVSELRACFQQLEIGVSDAELSGIISQLADESGNIQEDDFVRVMHSLVAARAKSGRAYGTKNKYWPQSAPSARTVSGQWAALKARVWVTMEDPSSSVLARVISLVVMLMIVGSVSSLVVESDPSFHGRHESTFFVLEVIAVAVFTAEYLLRLASCDIPRLEFVRQPLNIVDLVAIFPFYLEVILGSVTSIPTTSLRVVRLVRVFRLFKISRYMTWLRVFWATVRASAAPLGMILFVFGIVIIVFSSIIYYAERGTWDESRRFYVTADGRRSAYESIPASFWWCLVTMTTIGFGDDVPVTTFGKVVAAATALCGVLMLAIPISVITASFASEHSKASKTMRISLELQEKVKDMPSTDQGHESINLWYLRSWLGLVKGNRQRLQATLKQVELQSREVFVSEVSSLVDDFSSKVSAEQRFVRRVILHRQNLEASHGAESPPQAVF